MKDFYTLYTKAGILLLSFLFNSYSIFSRETAFTASFTDPEHPSTSVVTIDSFSAFQDQNVSCFGSNDGSCSSVVSPAGSYTYSLDGGIQTNSIGFFSGLTPGIHTVCVSDGTTTLCDTVQIDEPAPLQIVFTTDSLVSCLGNDGALSASISGGTNLLQGYLTFWEDASNNLLNPSPNNFNQFIHGLTPGIYSLTIEDDHGCFYISSTQMNSAPPLLVNASYSPINCYGGGTSIVPSSTGGILPITYTINGLPIQSDYLAGTYTVTATDLKGCSASTSIIITNPAYNVQTSSETACDTYTWNINGAVYTASGMYSFTNLNSQGCEVNHVLNLTINQSTNSTSTITANDSYMWSENGATYTTSGTYTTTYLNPLGCAHTSTLNLTIIYTHLTVLDVFQDQNISCFGFNDGSCQAIPQSAGNYTYTLDGVVATNNIGFFGGLTPGIHTVCATDGVYTVCDTVLITEPDPLQIQFNILELASCFNNDGSIDAIVTGGTTFLQPYLTTWTDSNNTVLNPAPNNFATSISGLAEGVYQLMIEDDHGCFLTQSVTLGHITPLQVSAANTSITCYGGTSIISPSATGGSAPVSYTINGNSIQPNYVAGTYTVTAMDSKGCTSETIITISEPAYIINNFTETSCDSYHWMVSGATYTTSGIYSFTNTNSLGCEMNNILNLTINQSSSTTANVTAIDTYTWLENGATYTLTGIYSHTTINAVGCTHTSILNLTMNYSHLTILTAIQDQNISCYGFNDGSTQAIPQPAGNYTYTLDGGVASNSIGFFGSLTPGIHTVCATDGIYNVCDTVLITEPDPLQIQFTIQASISCLNNDGEISAVITGGTPILQPYLTNWTDQNNTTLNPAPNNFAQSISGLSSGNYSLTIEDDHGCFLTQSIALNYTPLTITTTYNPIACQGGSTTISINTNGGVGAIDLLVNGGAPLSSYTAGTYTITASDTKGCTSISILTLTDPGSANTNETITACDSYTWILNGVTYTNSGIYTYSYTTTSGCSAIATLNLTINHSSLFVSTESHFQSYTWAANGITYTASGVYTATLINSVGCDSNLVLNLTITGATMAPIVLLSGPYNKTTGLMSDALRVMNLVPTTEPYSSAPYNKPQIGEIGRETTTSSVLAITGNNAIVDWVFIEIRSALNPSIIVATKRALLQRDGDVVNVDGVSPVTLNNLQSGNYYVSIKHRNHLGVMTASPVSLSASNTIIDFTSANPVYAMSSIPYNNPRKLIGNIGLLWSGDANNNKAIKYNGSSNEKDPILNTVGAGTPNNTIIGYRMEDINMDGKVKYNNVDNDRNAVLLQVGASTPNSVIYQHVNN